MIPQNLSLKSVKKTSFAVIRIAVDTAVKKAEHVPFGPFALMLANTIFLAVQAGPTGTWVKVKDAVGKVHLMVWNSLPASVRTNLEAFLVDVLKQLV